MCDIIDHHEHTLKLIMLRSGNPDMKENVRTALETQVSSQHIQGIFGDGILVFTEADPSTIRDWLKPSLSDQDHLFVAEFEHWSGYGAEIDKEWLAWRGH
ncbi:MAG: hypothetical protein HW403_898 [Dehalococcoidia bacterium]|nr:hypothetical protein [Dehalococcoidia bacterium]